jgi:superfamily II DNA or RNA helicase
MGERTVDDAAFVRGLAVHPTDHVTGPAAGDDVGDAAGASIQSVFRGLVEDEARTGQICADIAAASHAGRNCLVLSQWTEHLARLKAQLEVEGLQPDVLQGGMGKKARRVITDRLAAARSGDGVVLLATGSFLGEGFDCPALDTLFLAFPIAFKGRLVQYVGRVLRPIVGKSRAEVHDYVDARVPVLVRMHAKRLAAYASLGFDVRRTTIGRS